MRIILLALAVTATAVAQSVPVISVTDENGVAVRDARVTLEAPPQAPARCQTDFSGRCQFLSMAPGTYLLSVEKEGFYATSQPSVQIAAGSTLEVTITHQQEVKEVVDVVESPPAIDPAQVSAQEKISGLDVLNIVYPATQDYRNVLNFIPGVVQDQSGQPHVAGSQTYQTVTLLDGFNVTQPANGLLLLRLSTDSFRSIEVEPSREPAEDGRGSGGVLSLNTGIGDDRYRFYATDFVPSLQNKHGWRIDQFVPRFTFSGPIRKGKLWFYDAFDGKYDNLVYTELPVGQDNDHIIRFDNLVKLQANLTHRDILTFSFLPNYLHDQYAYLSPLSPQLTNPKDIETVYVGNVKNQHYFTGGQLLEAGFAFNEYNLKLTPYGNQPYIIPPAVAAAGNFYLTEQTRARRWQGLTNLYLPTVQWHGRHDIKVGADVDRISYDAQFARSPISFLQQAPATGQTAAPCPVDANGIPLSGANCARYSTFSGGQLSQTFNVEASGYVQDRWLVRDKLLLEPGLRFDWDEIVRHPVFSPRFAGTYVLDNVGNTKLSAGIGFVYDGTPLYLIARPYAGERTDYFFDSTTEQLTSTVLTRFTVNRNTLEAPRFLNWSIGIEKKLPKAIYVKAEFLEKRGRRGFVYDALNGASGGNFFLENTRHDRYDAFQITARHNFKENYTVAGAYTRSSATSNQALDFNVDNPTLSAQQPGPFPWDAPNRLLSWGYVPFFKLPVVHQMELAYSMEARTGFPFNSVDTQQRLIGSPGAQRFPDYFSLNMQLEKRFHFLGYYLALRGGFDNISGRCNPFVVNNVIDPATHPSPTFSACEGRAFTTRIRLLGRK
jgi:carboxypeptidase family protein